MITNRPTRLFAIAALSSVLAACATNEPQPAPSEIPVVAAPENTGPQPQLQLKLASGTYRCDLGLRVDVQRDAHDAKFIKLKWKGKRLTLQRLDSTSGLPRFEDNKNGLLWIDLPWKSVLMDANSGHPLANECKATG